MTLARGRLLRQPAASPAAQTAETRTYPGRRVPRALLEAAAEGRKRVAEAERHAAALIERAGAEASRIREAARAEGRTEGLAETAALALALREREARADDAALDRTLALARLLAERLVGAALQIGDAAAVELARGALEGARGARRVVLRAHPEDAPKMQAATHHFDPEGRVHTILADAALGPGDIVLETEVGTVDARLGAGIERLATRLREALRP